MALTDAEKNKLKNDILNAIKAESQSVDELLEVASLANQESSGPSGYGLGKCPPVAVGRAGDQCGGHCQRSRHEGEQRGDHRQ